MSAIVSGSISKKISEGIILHVYQLWCFYHKMHFFFSSVEHMQIIMIAQMITRTFFSKSAAGTTALDLRVVLMVPVTPLFNRTLKPCPLTPGQ